MSNILNNYSLRNHNTFGVDAKAKYFASFNSEDELVELLKDNICKTEPLFILGGGSNILLTQDFDGLILGNNIKGIEIITENEKSTSIAVGAGEIWHDFVLWSIRKNLSGNTPQNWRQATYYRYWMHRAHHDVPAHYAIRTERYKLIFYYGLAIHPRMDEIWASGPRQHVNQTNLHKVSPWGATRPEATPAHLELYDLEKDPYE